MYACSKVVHTYVCMYVLMLQSCTEIDRGISLIEQYTTVVKYVVKSRMFRPEVIFSCLTSNQLTKSFGSKYPEYVRMYHVFAEDVKSYHQYLYCDQKYMHTYKHAVLAVVSGFLVLFHTAHRTHACDEVQGVATLDSEVPFAIGTHT